MTRRWSNRTASAGPLALAVCLSLLAGVALAPSSASAASGRPEVLIYYANETAPDQTESHNYETFIRWLETSHVEKARNTAESLRRDMRLFPAAVDLEAYTLRHMLPSPGSRAGAVLFTNRLVRSGKFLLYRPGREEFQEVNVPAPAFENYILTANPLAAEEVFTSLLGEVAERFDPAEHDFILVTKSHGSKKMSLVPRLAVGHEETSRDEVLALVEGRIPEDRQPNWVGQLGVTKERYLSVLAAAGTTRGMRFTLVVMESCDGAIDEALRAKLPRNVDRLCVIDRYAATYINLLYGDVLQHDFTETTLAEAMDRFTAVKFTTLVHAPPQPRQVARFHAAGLLYCVPLLLWAIIVCVPRGTEEPRHPE